MTDDVEGAGGSARHVPVLATQAIEFLSPQRGGLYIDGTFGAGGYTRLILATPETRVIGIDRDPSAIARGFDLVREAGGRLTLIEETLSRLDEAVSEKVDGAVFDFGVSSMQLDEAERGFSFRLDGPLDMRMGGDGPSAADVVAQASEKSLTAIIAILGEERFARGVARAIVRARAETRLTTTRALADVIGRVVHARPGEIHPATRTFQGLRIFVNDELGEIRRALAAAERLLKPDGRLVAVSFHSLEDRIVKSFFTERGKASAGSRHLPEREAPPPTFLPLTKKPVIADDAEIARNPRARSAKLRAGMRTAAPPRVADIIDDERLPTLSAVMEGA